MCSPVGPALDVAGGTDVWASRAFCTVPQSTAAGVSPSWYWVWRVLGPQQEYPLGFSRPLIGGWTPLVGWVDLPCLASITLRSSLLD